MPKVMKCIFCGSFLAVVFFAGVYLWLGEGWLLTVAITFSTITYHFGMRLAVGYGFDRFMHNKADYRQKWYQMHPVESKLYKLLKVKKWKGNMPTYQPDLFSPQKHTWNDIAQAMCQAELVHETIVLLSFVPILASIWFGAFYVFLGTSICAAFYDLLFVIMQRYNRPRVVRLALKEAGR